MTLDDLMEAFSQAFDKGPYNVMRESEERNGAEIVEKDSPLLGGEWPHDVLVTRLGKDIRIVAIYNPFKGNGAFSRLINRIIDFGFRPVVVCPTIEMKEICKRWGWKEQIVGSTFHDREDRMIPTRKWMKQRAIA
ncbi:MAG TPA: hypothetical protein VIH61_05345 [Waddliaceae bacterium]